MNELGTIPGQSRKALSETDSSGTPRHHYRIRFRDSGRESTACADSIGLHRGDVVMVRREQGLEPAIIGCHTLSMMPGAGETPSLEEIVRLATEDEQAQYRHLLVQEGEAFAFCQQQVERLQLVMHLVRVERFFNGSKIIFYFTAENRVDFRELVKILVQQYRTRIEMRQIGVRHETQMLGGLGSCGRELCCSTFLNKFDSVSVKMAKAQDLPLNPAKISGLCNRLLCCLTYEYDSYRTIKRQMPRVGRTIHIDAVAYQVVQQHPLNGSLTVVGPQGDHRLLREEEWQKSGPEPPLQEEHTASGNTGTPSRRRRHPGKTRTT